MSFGGPPTQPLPPYRAQHALLLLLLVSQPLQGGVQAVLHPLGLLVVPPLLFPQPLLIQVLLPLQLGAAQ